MPLGFSILVTPFPAGPEKSECLLFPPKADVKMNDLDSVRMSAFGHKRSYAGRCILTVNQRLLSAKSGHSLTVKNDPIETTSLPLAEPRLNLSFLGRIALQQLSYKSISGGVWGTDVRVDRQI